MSKRCLLHNMLNFNLVQIGIFYELLSVDESMVSLLWMHSAKMFVRGKPIRFVYKIGACVKVMVIRIKCRYIRESSQTRVTSL